jgi:hypothetical protein
MEIACVNELAAMFEKGESYVMANPADDEKSDLNASPEQRAAILETLESMGIIADATHSGDMRYLAFRITSQAVQVARAIKAKHEEASKPEDIVEQLKGAAKSNRIIAWLIIAFIVVTALVTFVNQLWELLRKFGVGKG